MPTETLTPFAISNPQQFLPGDTVIGQVNKVNLRTNPSPSSAVMETYGGGSMFKVLDPDDSSQPYPVIENGVAWIRVQAQDGLVGWIDTDTVNVD